METILDPKDQRDLATLRRSLEELYADVQTIPIDPLPQGIRSGFELVLDLLRRPSELNSLDCAAGLLLLTVPEDVVVTEKVLGLGGDDEFQEWMREEREKLLDGIAAEGTLAQTIFQVVYPTIAHYTWACRAHYATR